MTAPEALAVIARVVPSPVLIEYAQRLEETERRRLSRPVQLHLGFREGTVAIGDVLPKPPSYSAGPTDRRRA